MRIEWQGQAARPESVPAGVCAAFELRRQTQFGILVRDESKAGSGSNELVSLTLGYEGHRTPPVVFELSVLGDRMIYAFPDATIMLPTDLSRIHPGWSGMEAEPGVLVLQGDQLFMFVAYNHGMRLLDLNTGTLLTSWPLKTDAVRLSAWSIIWRVRDEERTLFDFKCTASEE